ncbi:hypothetical protein CDAR_64931 [Caerostris darwini]|uniref:Uncharacterized protein n=1 Tax=Caerostris darwini TaxID=1538125 RepID=A0AAV4VZ29_9ARAC|nr:hypothetical protein CDAR_64931 [Caerostris darwini]
MSTERRNRLRGIGKGVLPVRRSPAVWLSGSTRVTWRDPPWETTRLPDGGAELPSRKGVLNCLIKDKAESRQEYPDVAECSYQTDIFSCSLFVIKPEDRAAFPTVKKTESAFAVIKYETASRRTKEQNPSGCAGRFQFQVLHRDKLSTSRS